MGLPLNSAIPQGRIVLRSAFLAAVTGAACAFSVQAGPVLDLSFAAPVQSTTVRAEALTSFNFAVGPFARGAIPLLLAEGPLSQTAFKIDAPGQTTLQLMLPLRDQIAAAGFKVIYECETQSCGGFDFRYGVEIIAEPEMHIDLGDFRYLAAKRKGDTGDDVLSVMVSKSPDHGFVQVTQVGGFAKPASALTAATKTPDIVAAPLTDSAPVAPYDLGGTANTVGARLDQGPPLVLEDLVFPSGSSTLAKGNYASLQDLAAWLRANPARTVILVGHTDASGGAAANLSLSKLRAQSVRQHLIKDLAIPIAQIAAEGVGSSSPRDSNATDAGRQKNRRVEVMKTSTP